MAELLPVLKGFVRNRLIRVWCPYCRVYHTHRYDKHTGEGHRVAHCSGRTPFSELGYYIMEYPKDEVSTLRGAVLSARYLQPDKTKTPDHPGSA